MAAKQPSVTLVSGNPVLSLLTSEHQACLWFPVHPDKPLVDIKINATFK